MAMFRGVRHANTQIQRQIQREIRKYNYSRSSTLQLQWKLDQPTCQCTALRNPPMNVKGTRTKVYWGPSVFVFVFVYLHV